MNDAFLEDLRGQLADGAVVAVVGAGVSMSATQGADVASWTGLLRNGVKYCQEIVHADEEWANRARADVDSGDMDGILATAEKITNKLGGSDGADYRLWLENTIGKLKPTAPEALEALKDLAIPIITTNYDGLLEAVTGRDPVTWKEVWRVQEVLRGRDKAIIHLHGYWRNPESVVLGIRSYDAILGSKVQEMLRALAGMKCMLLIGFGTGLQDPNFSALRKWMAATYGDSSFRHFRLYCEGEAFGVQSMHDAAERMGLISYGVDHKDLVPFLRQLGDTTRAAALTATQPPGDHRQQWSAPAWPAVGGGVTQRATMVAESQLAVLKSLKEMITPELYEQKVREIVTQALELVSQGFREGSSNS